MRAFVVALLILASCTKTNPNVCCTDEADCNAKGIPVGSICEAGLICRGNQCISEPCTSPAQCDPAAPYCVSELCAEACTDDLQCPGAGQASDAVFCVAGTCVACRDSADCTDPSAGVCDAGSCRACAVDSECASNFCDSGQCVAESAIVYVSPTGSATSGCAKDMPCTLVRGWAVVSATRSNMKLLPGVHVPPVTADFFPSGFIVTLHGPATIDGPVAINLSGSTASTLRLKDLDMSGAACNVNTALVPVATFELDHVKILADPLVTNTAVSASRCILRIVDSDIRVNDPNMNGIDSHGLGGGGGQSATIERTRIEIVSGSQNTAVSAYEGASIHIVNCLVRGGSTVNGSVLVTTSTGASTISFTTFYNGWLKCPTGNLLVALHDNIWLNESASPPADTVTGTACSHNYELIKPQATAPTGANNILNMDPRFVNAGTDDFHLLAGSPAIDAADPAATEAVDLEGTARPQGARRDIGALEYK